MKEGLKFDGGKLKWELLPLEAVEKIVEVLTYGAKKYAPNNWKGLEEPIERYMGALLRHLSAWRQGQEVDEESGLPHVAMMATNALFLVWFAQKEKEAQSGKDR